MRKMSMMMMITPSLREEGHDEHDDRPFDYCFLVLARVADAFLRDRFPKGYACAHHSLEEPDDHPTAGAHRAEGRHQHPPAPAAPQTGRTWREVHRAMGGGEVVRIGEKTVHKSDTCTHQSRLLLNQGLEAQVYEHVLEGERNEINSSRGMMVEVLNYCGERFQMICRYRASQKGMVFNSGWSKFLKHDGSHLKEGESLLLLAFRTQQQGLLCLRPSTP